jgi:uncharacterized protein DUF6498
MNKSLVISTSLLLGSNLIALFCAIWLRWNLVEIVLLYWVQALIIGIFQRRKVRDMVAYAMHPDRADWYRINRSPLTRGGMHNGFAGIYGVFWVAAGIILLIKTFGSERLTIDPVTILLASSTFVFSHWWSYRNNKQTDERRIVDINVLLLPLFRMFLPLHVFSVVIELDGTTTPAVIAVWMATKTAVDVGAHVIEHTSSRRVPTN